MDKHRRFIESQRGQSIVIIALAMMAMLALAGLAIDGGNLFLQRRRAQNAADASALAGTRVLAELLARCADGDSADDAQVAAAVTEMVETNGFSVADGSELSAWYVDKDTQRLGVVGDLDDDEEDDTGAIPRSATGVEVELGASFPTHFVKVVGVDSGAVGVQAMGMTGRIIRFSGGMLPMGVPMDVALDLADDPFYVLESNGRFCRQENGSCIGAENDPDSQRGWLNLNYVYDWAYRKATDPLNRACSRDVTNEGCEVTPPGIQGYASGQCTYPYDIYAGHPGQQDADFIHGSPGSRTSSLQAVYDNYPIGSSLWTPVFDRIYDGDELEDLGLDPPQQAAALHYECPTVNDKKFWPEANGYLYHIVGWIGFELDDPITKGGGGGSAPAGVRGEFKRTTIAPGVIGPSEGFNECNPLMIYGINLWE